MAIVALLILLALLTGGIGLAAEGLKWLLILAVVFFVASAFSYRGYSRR